MGERNPAIEALLEKIQKAQHTITHLQSEIEWNTSEINSKSNLIYSLEKDITLLKQAIEKLS